MDSDSPRELQDAPGSPAAGAGSLATTKSQVSGYRSFR
jgi:hypothetical protein